MTGRNRPKQRVKVVSPVLFSKPEKKTKNNSHRNLFLVFFILTFLIYGNTLYNGFAYDDVSVITRNSIVLKGISAIPEIFSTPYRKGFFVTNNDLYRPLSLAMFAIEYQASGGNAGFIHLINIIVNFGCVIALFYFLQSIFKENYVAVVIATLLFVVHPIHTEVVANIKSRDELLCFLFAFLSLNLFLKYATTGKKQQLFVGSLCFFLSLLAKETVVSFLIFVPLLFFVYKKDDRKRSFLIVGFTFLVFFLFFIIRNYVLAIHHANHTFEVKFIDNFLVNAPTLTTRVATSIFLLGKYIQLLIFPYPLLCDYSFNYIPFVGFADPYVLLTILFYIGIVITAVLLFRKNAKDPFAFSIIFFLTAIALFSNLVFLVGAAMAERFLFFASVGFCFALGLFLENILKIRGVAAGELVKNKTLMIILIPVLLLFSLATISRNMDWKDSLTLFKTDAGMAASNARLQFFYGSELLNTFILSGENDFSLVGNAYINLRNALQIYPEYAEAKRDLGGCYFFMKKYDSSELMYNASLTLKPEDDETISNMNVLYFTQNKYEQAIQMCKKHILLKPLDASSYSDMSVCYLHLNKVDSAIYILKCATGVNLTDNSIYKNLALAYKLAGKVDSAKKYQNRARETEPNFNVF